MSTAEESPPRALPPSARFRSRTPEAHRPARIVSSLACGSSVRRRTQPSLGRSTCRPRRGMLPHAALDLRCRRNTQSQPNSEHSIERVGTASTSADRNPLGTEPDYCPSHSTGTVLISVGRSTPSGCRPFTTASTSSGASSVSRSTRQKRNGRSSRQLSSMRCLRCARRKARGPPCRASPAGPRLATPCLAERCRAGAG